MISSLHIEGYRGLRNFDLENLRRVNLLVGSNNSGKTSVLEAMYLLASRGDLRAVWNVLRWRGEWVHAIAEEATITRSSVDVSHLFTGHELTRGLSIDLFAVEDVTKWGISLTVSSALDRRDPEQLSFKLPEDESALPYALTLIFHGYPSPATEFPLNSLGGLSERTLHRYLVPRFEGTPIAVQYLATQSLSARALTSLWDSISLTVQEETVLEALRMLEPRVERIAARASASRDDPRSGFIVKLGGDERPVPIGSLGDGVWRLLALVSTLTQCRGGVLLVDEIDTGLHYTALSSMWQVLISTAEKLDVQIFATTHSYDCVRGLAELSADDGRFSEQVSIQRIESGRSKSIPFTDDELRFVAEQNLEVR